METSGIKLIFSAELYGRELQTGDWHEYTFLSVCNKGALPWQGGRGGGHDVVRRTKAEAQETRNAILEAAETVFFERGVARSTLEEIARSAGVTRGAVYWHFRNKWDLFAAIYEQVHLPMHEILQQIFESDRPDALKCLEDFCATSLLKLHQDDRLRRVFTVLLLRCEPCEGMDMQLERQLSSRQQTMEELTRFFDRRQKAGSIEAKTEPRVLALALHGYMVGLYCDFLRMPSSFCMPDDAPKLAAHFFSTLQVQQPGG